VTAYGEEFDAFCERTKARREAGIIPHVYEYDPYVLAEKERKAFEASPPGWPALTWEHEWDLLYDELTRKRIEAGTRPYYDLPTPKPKTNNGQPHSEAYVQKVIDEECALLAGMQPDTQRNETLFKIAARFNDLIKDGDPIDPVEAYGRLYDAAIASGLTPKETALTIKSGTNR
jgi:hypothetical protein